MLNKKNGKDRRSLQRNKEDVLTSIVQIKSPIITEKHVNEGEKFGKMGLVKAKALFRRRKTDSFSQDKCVEITNENETSSENINPEEAARRQSLASDLSFASGNGLKGLFKSVAGRHKKKQQDAKQSKESMVSRGSKDSGSTLTGGSFSSTENGTALSDLSFENIGTYQQKNKEKNGPKYEFNSVLYPSFKKIASSSLALKSRNFMFKNDKIEAKKMTLKTKGYLKRSGLKVKFDDLTKWHVFSKKAKPHKEDWLNHGIVYLKIAQGFNDFIVRYPKLTKQTYGNEKQARKFWDGIAKSGKEPKIPKRRRYLGVLNKNRDSDVTTIEHEAEHVDLSEMEKHFKEHEDEIKALEAEGPEMQDDDYRNYREIFDDFLHKFDQALLHKVTARKSYGTTREQKDMAFLKMIGNMAEDPALLVCIGKKDFLEGFAKYLTLKMVNFIIIQCQTANTFKRLVSHKVFLKEELRKPALAVIEEFLDAIRDEVKFIHEVESTILEGLKGLSKDGVRQLKRKIFNFNSNSGFAIDLITGRKYLALNMERQVATSFDEIIDFQDLSTGEFYDDRPELEVPVYWKTAGDFLLHPQHAWLKQKVKFAEQLLNLVSFGIAAAALNSNDALMKLLVTYDIPETFKMASLNYRTEIHNMKKTTSPNFQVLTIEKSVNHKVSIRKHSPKTSSTKTGSGLFNSFSSQVMIVDALCGLLHPVVRADLLFSRKRFTCHESCTGHSGKLLLTCIRLGNKNMVNYLLKCGVKGDSKTCLGQTKEMFWDFDPEFDPRNQMEIGDEISLKHQSQTGGIDFEQEFEGYGEFFEDDKETIKNKTRSFKRASRSKRSTIRRTKDYLSYLDTKKGVLTSKREPLTPLAAAVEYAVSHGDADMVKTLLDYGAKVTECDNLSLRACLGIVEKFTMATKHRKKRNQASLRTKSSNEGDEKHYTFETQSDTLKSAVSSKSVADHLSRTLKIRRAKAKNYSETELRVKQSVACLDLIINTIQEHISNSPKAKTFRGFYATVLVKISLLYEALMEEQWDVVRFIAPSFPKHSAEFRNFEKKTWKNRTITTLFDSHENKIAHFEPVVATALSKVIDILLNVAAVKTCATTARAFNALYFIMMEYNIMPNAGQMNRLFDVLCKVLNGNVILRPNEKLALARILSTHQIKHFLQVERFDILDKRRLEMYMFHNRKFLSWNIFSSFRGRVSGGMSGVKSKRQKLYRLAFAAGMIDFANTMSSVPGTITDSIVLETFETAIVSRHQFELFDAITAHYHQSKDSKLPLAEHLQRVLNGLLKDCDAGDLEAANLMNLLLNQGILPKTKHSMAYLLRLIYQPPINLDNYYDPNVIVRDLSHIFNFKLIVDKLFVPNDNLDKDLNDLIEHFVVSLVQDVITSDVLEKSLWFQGLMYIFKESVKMFPDITEKPMYMNVEEKIRNVSKFEMTVDLEKRTLKMTKLKNRGLGNLRSPGSLTSLTSFSSESDSDIDLICQLEEVDGEVCSEML